MRKSAKRFLSTILALTLLCSCMTVLNASTAFAADSTLWVYEDNYDSSAGKLDETSIPSVLGLQTVDYTINETEYAGDLSHAKAMSNLRTATFKESIFDSGESNTLASRYALSMYYDSSDYVNRELIFEPTQTGTIELFAARDNSSGGSIRLYTYDEDGSRSSTYTTLTMSGGRTTTNREPVSFDVTAGEKYLINAYNSATYLYAIRFTPASSASGISATAKTVNGTTYAVFELADLTADTLANYDSYTVQYGDETKATGTTVYTGVDFDGDGSIGDDDIEPESGYVVAYVVSQSEDSTLTDVSEATYAAALTLVLNAATTDAE